MATVTCTDITTKGYNGGWKSWGTYGYAGKLGYASSGYTYYATQIKFTIPEYSEGDCTRQDSSDSTGLTFVVPYVCTPELSLPRAGIMYAKIYSSEFTKSAEDAEGELVTEYDTYINFSINDRYVHFATFNFGRKAPGTWYLLIYSSKCVQIGYDSTDGRKFSGTASYTPRSSIKAGTVTITDNYNNTFTITATQGASGTNNPSKGLTGLKWGYGGTDARTSTYSNGQTIAVTKDTRSTGHRWVSAEATTIATYGSNKTAAASVDINMYYEPYTPTVTLAESSRHNGRITTKKNWTFSWTCSPKSSSENSAVKGYYLYLYKIDSNGNYISLDIKDSSGAGYCYEYDGVYYSPQSADVTSITLDPEKCGIQTGDAIRFRVTAYSTDGKNNKLWSGDGYSAVVYVESSGIARVKYGGTWRESQVFVKYGGTWREAEAIYTKYGGTWRSTS